MKIVTVNDYVEQVHEKFPDLTEQEIKRILVYGWKMILQYVNGGNDVSIITNKFFFFIGRIPTKALDVFNLYCKKLSQRIKYMFKRTNSEWDGYYYFSRSESQYKEYLKQNRKKIKVFKDVYLYKLLEELKIKENMNPYIFRLNESKTDRMFKYYKELKTKDAELIIQRDALTMKDVMTSYNKFKYLKQK